MATFFLTRQSRGVSSRTPIGFFGAHHLQAAWWRRFSLIGVFIISCWCGGGCCFVTPAEKTSPGAKEWRLGRPYPSIKGFGLLGVNRKGYPEYRHVYQRRERYETDVGNVRDEVEYICSDFVLIPSGTHAVGWTKKGKREKWWMPEDETPRHLVPVDAFLIGKYEVTINLWERVTSRMPEESSDTDDSRRVRWWWELVSSRGIPRDDTRPVACSWYEAQRFCEVLGLSLPSEAQWEIACRAGTKTLFAFGDDLVAGQANFWDIPNERNKFPAGGARDGRLPVGSFPANGFGIYDMHGNVGEWCLDWYDPSFYKGEGASAKNPLNVEPSDKKV